MEVKKIKCSECGANLDIKEDLDSVYCIYCGTKNYITDDKAAEITRVEKAKLKARKENHEQDVKEEEDKIILWKKRLGLYQPPKTAEEERKEWKLVGIVWGIIILFVIIVLTINSIFGTKNPSLKNFNKLELQMTYSECKDILGMDGHLTSEEESTTIYTWYDVSCRSEEKDENGNCPVVIRLTFVDNKLTERYENGLK